MGETIGVTVRLLGPFAVEPRNGAPAAIRSRKARALLAFLAMRPDFRASREQLATLLWGDNSDPLARHSLRQCLTLLRKDLAGAAEILVFERDTVGLDGRAVTVDAREFASLSRASGAEHMARAAALYRGEFLADLALDIEDFDGWRDTERHRLRDLAARAFATLAAAFDQDGRGEAAIEMADRLVAIEPTREEWHRVALAIWARHRGREAALGRAKAFADVLRRELGVAPAAETEALVAAIGAGSVATVARGASRAPEPPKQETAPSAERPAAAATPVAPPPASSAVAPRPRRIAALAAAACAIVALAVAVAGIATGWRLPFGSAPPVWAPPHARSAAATPADENTTPIVVLPFKSEAANGADDRLFAQSLTHNLIGYLAQYGQLRVISEQTSDALRDQDVDVVKLGAELGVRYAIAGHLRAAQGGLTVAFQVVDAANRAAVWANQLTRDRADLAAIADDIPRGIARGIALAVTAADVRQRRGGPGDAETGALVMRGFAAEQIGPWRDNLSEAMRLFEQALRRDPKNLRAKMGITRVSVMAYGNLIELDPPVDLDRAERLIDQVLAHAPNNASAHYIAAQLLQIRGRLPDSIAAFGRALELNPSLTFAEAHIGLTMVRLGRPQEGLRRIEHYLKNAPPNEPALGYGYLFAGKAKLALGENRAALEAMLRASAFFPGSPRMQAWLAGLYATIGDDENAAKYAAEFRRTAPGVARRLVEGAAGAHVLDELSPVVEGLRRTLAKS